MNFIVSLIVTILLLLAETSNGKSLHRMARVPNLPINKFNLGMIDTCTTPELSICRDYVDYQVPAVLAEPRFVAIREAVILAAYKITKSQPQDGYNSTLCAQAFLELECRNQFPRCTQDSQGVRNVIFSDEGCDKLMNQCSPTLASRFIIEGYCSLNTTVPLGQCKHTSEYTGYQFCNAVSGWQDWYITDWMHLYLQRNEQQISAFKANFGAFTSPQCIERFTQFSCTRVGRCWDQGRQAELIPSQQDCNNLVNCFSSQFRGLISETLQCDKWPEETDKPSSTATPITTAPTREGPTTTATAEGQVLPGDDHVIFPSSNSRSSASTTFSLITQLTLIISLVALVVCIQIT